MVSYRRSAVSDSLWKLGGGMVERCKVQGGLHVTNCTEFAIVLRFHLPPTLHSQLARA